MDEALNNGLTDSVEGVAPVIPDEFINGDWHRRLVLPNQDGQLRLTPVRTARHDHPEESTRIRYLDHKQRHSA
jgi:hypothetical protein